MVRNLIKEMINIDIKTKIIIDSIGIAKDTNSKINTNMYILHTFSLTKALQAIKLYLKINNTENMLSYP